LSDEVVNKEILKDARFTVFNLLRVLKFFYSFKELEQRLGVQSQVLWRYVTLRAIPEKKSAQKILAKIREGKLIEEAMSRIMDKDKELWQLFNNPGILELTAIKVLDEYRRSKVGAVLSAPDSFSAALAALISAYLRSKLCIASHTPFSKNVVAECYQTSSGMVDVAAVPRDCIPKKSRVLVVSANATEYAPLAATINLVLKCHAEVVGVISLIGSCKAVQNAIASKLGIRPRIIILHDLDKQ